MLRDVIARNKAAEALGIEINGLRHWLSEGWPELVPVSALAKWQFPEDAAAQKSLMEAARKAIDADNLSKRYAAEPDYFAADNPSLGAGDFVPWLKEQGFEPGDHIKAWHRATTQPEQQDGAILNDNATDNTTISRRDKQLAEISRIALELGYFDLMNIPEGGKSKIKKVCLKNNALFTASGFGHAWKEGNKRGIIAMKDKEKYV